MNRKKRRKKTPIAWAQETEACWKKLQARGKSFRVLEPAGSGWLQMFDSEAGYATRSFVVVHSLSLKNLCNEI